MSAAVQVSSSRWGRLLNSQTAVDFYGRRAKAFAVSALLVLLTVGSLLVQGLNLGIDFTGGVSWDVPTTNGFTTDDAEEVLADNGLSTEGARLQERSSDSIDFVKVQVGDQPAEVGNELREAFAEAAGVELEQVNVSLVSASWGGEVTETAVRALVIFVIIVAIYMSFRFEWRMALAALAAMLHDIVVAIGIYSVLQFIVTPPTVIAFLTILGYSLYDTVVVFDRVKENEARFVASKPPYPDVLNASMNQVLMRSLNTSISSVVPVVSLLVIGAGVFGQATLAEFALALLIGMVVGVYSSIFIAVPLLGVLKSNSEVWQGRNVPLAVGEALREMVVSGDIGSRRTRAIAADATKSERKQQATVDP
ncbi:MAG: protein translocase subunit SecF, partial [Acidimicrobiia bacterium]